MTQEQEMWGVISLCEGTLAALLTKHPRERVSGTGKITNLEEQSAWHEDCTTLTQRINSAKEGMVRDAKITEDSGKEFHHWSTVDGLTSTFSYASQLDHKYNLEH